MPKFFGKVGYCITEGENGIYTENIVEKSYYGDITRNYRNTQSTSNLNDNVQLSNQISILADPFAVSNFHWIKYVEFMGAKWKVNSASVQYPRIILELGGVYNE